MVRVVRSTMLSMRVSPAIKFASENVLERLGLNITEAMEMFLRRMVIDQRIPFDVVAVDPETYTQLLLDWEAATGAVRERHTVRSSRKTRSLRRPKRE